MTPRDEAHGPDDIAFHGSNGRYGACDHATPDPAPLDVERFMRAQYAAGLHDSTLSIALVRRIAREYAKEPQL